MEPSGEFVIAPRSEAGNLASRFVELLSLMITQEYADTQRQKLPNKESSPSGYTTERLDSDVITSGELQFSLKCV